MGRCDDGVTNSRAAKRHRAFFPNTATEKRLNDARTKKHSPCCKRVLFSCLCSFHSAGKARPPRCRILAPAPSGAIDESPLKDIVPLPKLHTFSSSSATIRHPIGLSEDIDHRPRTNQKSMKPWADDNRQSPGKR